MSLSEKSAAAAAEEPQKSDRDVRLVGGVELESSGPNFELACILLAAGQSQDYVRRQCGFESRRAVAAFCRDEDTRREVAAITQERVGRLGKRALDQLERLVSEPQTDLRAHVLAIRTALEVSGDLRRGEAAPAKTVRELTVPELNELIAATRHELEARVARQRADGAPRLATK